jgi:hypothetical protein
MDFGVFLEQTRRGVNQGGAFHEMLEVAESAEAWRLDVVW